LQLRTTTRARKTPSKLQRHKFATSRHRGRSRARRSQPRHAMLPTHIAQTLRFSTHGVGPRHFAFSAHTSRSQHAERRLRVLNTRSAVLGPGEINHDASRSQHTTRRPRVFNPRGSARGASRLQHGKRRLRVLSTRSTVSGPGGADLDAPTPCFQHMGFGSRQIVLSSHIS